MNVREGVILRNRYRLDELVGRGGMAEVYRAFDLRRQARVAIKILREDLAEDPDFVRRFAREAEALATLDHPNIVRFYSFERQDEIAFIVLDYVTGITLRRLLLRQQGSLSLAEVTRILRQVGGALQYAHDEGFVHRDVKPGNVMLREDGVALLSDFGIARALESATVTTATAGTPAYMSPEQIRGQAMDRRSDIYSLGVMLYEMTVGRRPFTGEEPGLTETSTVGRLREAHLRLEPPDPSMLNPALPAGTRSVLLRALAKDPNARWPDVLSLLHAWEEAAGEDQTRGAIPALLAQSEARPAVAPITPLAASPVSGVAGFGPTGAGEDGSPRRRVGLLVAVVLFAGVVLLTVFGMLRVFSGPESFSTDDSLTAPITATKTTTSAASAGSAAVAAVRNVDVYAGPGNQFSVVGVIPAGAKAPVVGRNPNGDWYAIAGSGLPNGQGWVPASAVVAENTGSVPVATPPPLPAVSPTPASTPAPTTSSTFQGWKGEYFVNSDMVEPPMLVRDNPHIYFNWGVDAPAPGIPSNNYSVRWNRRQFFEAGAYTFSTNVEGGVRLWLDGRLLIDSWQSLPLRLEQADSSQIAAGDHDLRVDYRKLTGNGQIAVTWRAIPADPPTAVIEGPAIGQVGQELRFSARNSSAAPGMQITGYDWRFGDGDTADTATTEHTYTVEGVYTVQLTVLDNAGLSDTANVQVEIHPPPTPTPEPTRSESETVELQISSGVLWQNTGIYVTSGDRVRIVAAGQWTNDANNSAVIPFGPEGGETYASHVFIPSTRVGALIARIDQGPAFPVGSYFEAAVGDSGNLYLTMNETLPNLDPSAYLNNAGSLNVAVTISRAP